MTGFRTFMTMEPIQLPMWTLGDTVFLKLTEDQETMKHDIAAFDYSTLPTYNFGVWGRPRDMHGNFLWKWDRNFSTQDVPPDVPPIDLTHGQRLEVQMSIDGGKWWRFALELTLSNLQLNVFAKNLGRNVTQVPQCPVCKLRPPHDQAGAGCETQVVGWKNRDSAVLQIQFTINSRERIKGEPGNLYISGNFFCGHEDLPTKFNSFEQLFYMELAMDRNGLLAAHPDPVTSESFLPKPSHIYQIDPK